MSMGRASGGCWSPSSSPPSSGAQDILEQWLKCQGKWLYLEPIFGAEEIMKQIPREGIAFKEMDTTWRGIMVAVQVRGRACIGAWGARSDG